MNTKIKKDVPKIIRIINVERRKFALNLFLNAFGDNAPYQTDSLGRFVLKIESNLYEAEECFNVFSQRLKRNNIEFTTF